MTTAVQHPADIPAVTASDGARLGRAQREVLLQELERLEEADWAARTECPRWTVHAMVAHVVAAAENTAAPHRMAAGMVLGPLRHRGDSALDAMNECGIDRRRDATPQQLVDDLRRVLPGAVVPRWFRPLPLAGGGLRPGTTGAALAEVIMVRDVWLHRHDIARATGRQTLPESTDAEVVAHVVRDLARTWAGPAVQLTLAGAEGGSWLLGPATGRRPHRGTSSATVPVSLPAVEFLRHLSGRQVDPHLFEGVETDAAAALRAARIVF